MSVPQTDAGRELVAGWKRTESETVEWVLQLSEFDRDQLWRQLILEGPNDMLDRVVAVIDAYGHFLFHNDRESFGALKKDAQHPSARTAGT